MMSGGVIGIEFDSFLKLAFSSGEITIVIIQRVGKRNMGLSQTLVDLESLERRRLGLGKHFIRSLFSAAGFRSTYEIVRIGKTAVSQSKPGICRYCLLVVFDGSMHRLIGP